MKKLVPKDLEYSHNKSEKTTQELFTENHKDMVKDAESQLVEMGNTCSSLVAAVAFASSFSIPGKDDKHNPGFYNKTAFKVFNHADVISLSCASTALVLFSSLLTSPYREQDFGRSLPTKYFFANRSFALVAVLVAFSCNIYLNIYGGGKAGTTDITRLRAYNLSDSLLLYAGIPWVYFRPCNIFAACLALRLISFVSTNQFMRLNESLEGFGYTLRWKCRMGINMSTTQRFV